jgi:hypothetical protein
MRVSVAISLLAVLVCGALVYAASGGVADKGSATEPDRKANKIWSALVLATNDSSPKPAPGELQEFAPRLKRVFGYNQFQLIGSATNEIGDRAESWLVPSESFWFGLRARRALSKEARGGFLLSLQLYQDKRPLVDTEVKLAPGSPLFIRGPQYGKGQLVIVLQVQR